MNHVRQWWHQPDRYDWLSDYLASRRLIAVARGVMTVVMAVFAGSMALISFSPVGQHGAARGVALMVAAGFAVLSGVYAARWPTQRLSAGFSIFGSAGIAAVALSQTEAHVGLLTCWAFVGLAAYVASFHNPRLLTFTVGVALMTAAACGLRMALAGDVSMAVATFLLATGALLTAPFGGQILVRLLWNDAVSTDPLTGLANRRGFRRSARTLIRAAARRGTAHFSVVMIDLDGFKRLNDTLGHAAGDRLLVEVAASIRTVAGPGILAARVGGEEFLVAQASPARDVEMLARRLCTAIAANPWGVTASLGIAGVAVPDAADDIRPLIEGVIAAADMAMYEAKRAGGNQIRQSSAAA
ncbi:GGDEF domain-containing protein [Mycolicibacterium sp. CH28]|uniref:GGDEF domain-containing protein n=1 Tax=Mycolicibacterium sp. CH28 TaxID=2512237 RepID=UPI00107FD642|nr:GGDEF domain-containing protein [Mycolicibacterium sp. CH28]TGD88993.1 GGDEF domain-containing protein [Mycolicibacterium sp. CH28]